MKGKREIVVSFFLLFDPLENDVYTRWILLDLFVDKEGFVALLQRGSIFKIIRILKLLRNVVQLGN